MLNAGIFRGRNLVAVAIAAIAAFAAVAVYSGLAQAGNGKHSHHGAKHGFKHKKVSCELKLHAVKPPRTIEAENFGTISCDKKFLGEGVQHDSSTVTPTSQFSGHFTGPVKQFFDKGTLSGTFTISYVTDPTTLAVTYNGTIDITKGTGKYKGLKGTGTLVGASPDAIKSTIQEELTLTRKKH
jgi:hypothetical protein